MITNGAWKISAEESGLKIFRHGKNYFSGRQGMQLQVVEDPWGSWGGMAEEPDSFQLEKVVETWKLVNSAVLEEGPLRSKLWTRWEGARSWIELTFTVADGRPELRCEARLLWNERSRRLKMVLPSQGQIECEVPASRIKRDVAGQVPIGRWVTRTRGGQVRGFASDVLSDMDAVGEAMRITIARATRYADDIRTSPSKRPWQPAVDSGELKFQFALFDEEVTAERVVSALLAPPAALIVPPALGPLSGQGSLGEISHADLKVLSLQRVNAQTIRLRLQNIGRKTVAAKFRFRQAKVALAKLQPQQIQTYLVNERKGKLTSRIA